VNAIHFQPRSQRRHELRYSLSQTRRDTRTFPDFAFFKGAVGATVQLLLPAAMLDGLYHNRRWIEAGGGLHFNIPQRSSALVGLRSDAPFYFALF
jgi:hypothetical protein